MIADGRPMRQAPTLQSTSPRETAAVSRIWFSLALLCCSSSALFSRVSASPIAAQLGIDVALVGAKIYSSPWAKPIASGVVLVKDGRIAAVGRKGRIRIPRSVQILHCDGLTLTAGFWNSHVHLHADEWTNAAEQPAEKLATALQTMFTKYGFTTVFDTGSVLENTNAIRRRIEIGEIDGPRIRTTGMLIFPKDASPHSIGQYPNMDFPEIDTSQEAPGIVLEALSQGADAIKIHIMGPTADGKIKHMSLEAVKALVDEAHRRGKLAFAHPGTPTGWQEAIDGGVDLIMHANPNPGSYIEAQIATLVKTHRAITPTLTLFRYDTIREGTPNIALRVQTQAVDWLRKYLEAGGTVLFGTDVGYIEEFDPTEEYQQMARAGMSGRQILASLTTTPAECLGAAGQSGRLDPGMEADMVLLGGDPVRDVKALSHVRYTFRAGRIIYRSKGGSGAARGVDVYPNLSPARKRIDPAFATGSS